MKSHVFKLAIAPALLMILISCSAEQTDNGMTPPEAGNPTARADEPVQETAEPGVSAAPAESAVTAGEIDRYEHISITDWRDDNTVVVSKENENLGTMSLGELEGSFPKSLYFYHLDTKEYELIKEQENVFLGDAVLSSDNRYLLYSEFSLGDPAYHVTDLGSKKTFSLMGEPIAGALSAYWADEDTVIGPAYSGGAFTASTSGTISAVEGLEGESLIVVRQIKNKLYYTTNANESLQTLDLSTKEKATLDIDHVGSVIPSPHGDRLLVRQVKDSAQTLLLSDIDGENQQVIAEGAELGGISWSPDQRLIAYSVSVEGNGTASGALYIYDLLSGESAKVAEGTGKLATSWSPSGKQLAYTEWSEGGSSSIMQVKY